MRLVKVTSLWPGMKVRHSIYSHNGREVLTAGETLDQNKIQNLITLGIQFVWVEDGFLNNLSDIEIVARETRVAAVEQVKKILLKTMESGRLVIEPKEVYSTVNELTENILAKDNLLYNMVDLRIQDDYTFSHSVNVCILALMTGITLGFSREELSELGVGALLHDIGKVKVPDNILNKPGPLNEHEFSIMQKHTLFGYEIIKESPKIGDIPANIALQHHENYDGSGYPSGIKGDNIIKYAQIISLADRFDAITANRIYRKAFPPHEAYEMCAAAGNYYVSNDIAKAFLHNIAAYPIGTVVELNNGMVGMVLETPKGYSLFPKVRVMLDENYRPLNQQQDIPLFNRVGLGIIRVIQY